MIIKDMAKKMRFCFIFLLILVLLADCQTIRPTVSHEAIQQPMPTIDMSTVNAYVTAYPVETPIPAETIPPMGTPYVYPGTEAIILQAKNDLSQNTCIDLEKIIVLEVEAVEWSDGSLGCPQPGTDYLQVITSGYRILLEASGVKYEYHSNRDAYVIYCREFNPSLNITTP